MFQMRNFIDKGQNSGIFMVDFIVVPAKKWRRVSARIFRKKNNEK